MQLSAPSRDRPRPTHVATALRTATEELGQRPAITVLSPRGREEQGVASLAQWAAKGAHLLELDLLLEPGDRLALDAPLSWTSAAVCLAAWWAGVAIEVDGDGDGDSDAEVAVVHESRVADDVRDLFRLGDAIDGSPLGEVDGEPWVGAVQAFPDQPPEPRAGADAVALVHGDATWTQSELLDLAAQLAPDGGTFGVEAGDISTIDGLVAVALRPLVVGRPTVVLHEVDRDSAAGEKVRRWWSADAGAAVSDVGDA